MDLPLTLHGFLARAVPLWPWDRSCTRPTIAARYSRQATRGHDEPISGRVYRDKAGLKGITWRGAVANDHRAASESAAPILTKEQQMIDLLRRPGGTTVGEIAIALDWQETTVRGLMRGVLRVKPGLNCTVIGADLRDPLGSRVWTHNLIQ